MTMPMSFFNQTKFGRIISRMTSDIDSVRAGVQDVAFVLVVQGLQMTASAALMAWYNWKLFSLMLADGAGHLGGERKLPARNEPAAAQGAGILEPGRLHAGRIGERHPGDAGVCAAGNQRRLFPQTDQCARRKQRGRGAGVGGVRAAAAVEEPAVPRRDGVAGRVTARCAGTAGCTWRWATW